MTRMRIPLAAAMLGIVGSCHGNVSDTGYVGTWARGKPESRSIISIGKSGDQYRFTWKLKSVDGKWIVTCNADAHCVETFDGKKIGDYQFTTRVDPETGHLIVQGDHTAYEESGEVKGTVRDLDELVVENQGLSLGCYTFERNGEKMTRAEGPQRHFDKISDAVLEPGS